MYIGQTSQGLINRLAGHLSDAKNIKKKEWIDRLKGQNLLPLIELLEVTDEERVSDREKYWIGYYHSLGTTLLNENEYTKLCNVDKMKPVIKWLNKHPLIVINRLEKKVGIPQRVLKKVIDEQDGRALPEVYHEPLINELKKYGLFDDAD
jgi:hypothetical protein